MLITDNYLMGVCKGVVGRKEGPLSIGASSLDIHIQNRAWVEYVSPAKADNIIHIAEEDVPFEQVTFSESNPLVIEPGQFVKLITQERFFMPCDISGMFTLRSHFARHGLDQAASLMLHPNWEGHLILEVRNNLKKYSIVLKPEDKVGQIHFFSCDPYEAS